MNPARGLWLAAALVLALTACENDPDPSPQPYIVNGEEVKRNDFYAVVGLIYPARFDATRPPLCTGTLISSDIVLTAAHCACGDFRPTDIFIGWDERQRIGAGYYPVRSNGIAVGSACANGTTSGRLKQFRDLALVRLARNVTEAAPIGVAEDALVDRATGFRIVGFGAIDRRGIRLPGRKYQGSVQVTNLTCRSSSGVDVATTYGCMPGQEIVAASRIGTDTCKGDSGGPLFVAEDGTAGPPTLGDLVLAGVTSRSTTKPSTPCGEGGIYERLNDETRNWIEQESQRLRRGT